MKIGSSIRLPGTHPQRPAAVSEPPILAQRPKCEVAKPPPRAPAGRTETADIGPAAEMRGGETPGHVVDPGPPPRADPAPVPVPVWRPVARRVLREPYVAQIGEVFPGAMLVEHLVA